MALIKGVNAYATVDEAEAYFANRLGVPNWIAADAPSKAQALCTAALLLEEQKWTGTAISETQPLAFPRAGQYFDPRLGTWLSFEDDVVPTRVVNASIEIANHLLSNDGVLDDSGSVLNLSVSTIQLNTIKSAPQIPQIAARMIKPLLINAGSNSWWRAN